MIKSLSQLKKQLQAGTEFDIIGHCYSAYVGQHRKVTLANTQGFYSILPKEPDSTITLANNGRGSVLWWGTAPYWKFENNICALYSDKEHEDKNLIISFRVAS